jgi:lysozyme
MRTAATLLTASAAALLLVGARRGAVGAVEAGEGDYLGAVGVLDAGALIDRAEGFYNLMTEAPADVDTDTAARNETAFLHMLQYAEGTAGQPDPYRVCFGYRHTIASLADHPAVTGEWAGELLPDSMCINAGFSPGCKSTAAGAYQQRRATWVSVRNALGLPDFGRDSQDRAALELIRRRGALADVQAGRFEAALHKCRNEWASLPGNYAKQGQRSIERLAQWYINAGGTFA